MTAPWLMCYASSLRPWRCPYLFLFFRDWDCEAFTYLSPLIWDFLYGHVDDVTAGRSSLCSGSVVCSRSRAALVLPLGLVPGGFRSLGIFVCGVVAPVFSPLQSRLSVSLYVSLASGEAIFSVMLI